MRRPDLRVRSRQGALRSRVSQMLGAAAFAALFAGCGEGGESVPDAEQAEVPPPVEAPAEDVAAPELPVDSTVPAAPLGQDGWQYGRSSETDVDGDGVPERIVVSARAEVRNGQALWDDGQPWQVYVQEPSGELTLLFARYVQLGTVEARVTLAEEGERPTVLILEHLPDALILHEVEYRGPGDLRMRERMERRLDPLGDLASPSLP